MLISDSFTEFDPFRFFLGLFALDEQDSKIFFNRGKSVVCGVVVPKEGHLWTIPFEIQLVKSSEFEFSDVDLTCNTLAISKDNGIYSRTERTSIETAVADIMGGQLAPLIEECGILQ